MSDYIASSAGFSKSDLNQDISRVLDGQGKVDYLSVLNTYFPSRNLTLHDYSSTHSVKRKVKCLYVSSKDTVPLVCPRGWDLLVVMGVGFTRRECEDVTALLEQAASNESVVLGVPLQAMPGAVQLKELAAIKVLSEREPYNLAGPAAEVLSSRQVTLRKQLIERLRRSFVPGAFRWIYKGSLLEEAPAGNRNEFFSGVLESIYTRSPKVRMPGSRREVVEALDELLGLAYELRLPNISKRGGTRVIRDLLCRHGILKVEKDWGSYTAYKVCGLLSEDSALAPVWNALLEDIVGNGKKNCLVSLKKIVKKYTSIPYGVSLPFLALLMAAALRRFYPDIDLEHDGEPVDPAGVSLRSAIWHPQDWQLRYHPCSEHEASFLNAIVEMFPGFKAAEQANLWKTARFAMLSWYESLPTVTKVTTGFPSADAQLLVEFLQNKANSKSSKDMFDSLLPALRKYDGIPLEEEQGALLEWVRQAKKDVDGIAAWKADKLIESIGAVFGREKCPAEGRAAWLDEAFHEWFTRLHPGTAAVKMGEFARVLVELNGSQEDFEKRWFASLPQKLGIPALADWSADYTPTLISRIIRGKLELELWHVRALFPLESDTDARIKSLRSWSREVLEGMHLDKRDKEVAWLDILESMCWS